MNPATTIIAASAKPAIMWKACGANVATLSMPGAIQTALNTMVVTASQRHIRIRARAKAAAVTMAI